MDSINREDEDKDDNDDDKISSSSNEESDEDEIYNPKININTENMNKWTNK